MTTQEFIETINKLRLGNKNKWYFYIGAVNGYSVQLKGYNTWIQAIHVDNMKASGPMDCTVKDFKEFLTQAIA
jgi:hypothetical protein